MRQWRLPRAWLVSLGCVLAAGLMLAACSLDPSSSLPVGQAASHALGPSGQASNQPHSPAKGDTYQARLLYTARTYLGRMTLDEKLGQMFLIETSGPNYYADVDTMVRSLHAGALIIYGKNMKTPQQLKTYIATMQANAAIPLMVTMDEEGGVVDRLGYYHFDPPLPAAQDLAATGSTNGAEQAGETAAHEMQALGINTDLAPVVDVRSIPNAIEWTRLFGNDPTTVANYASAFLTGLQNNGEIACLKHWPGIGSISLDPHLTLPTVTRTLPELESTDFATFRALLAQNPGMIMVTHVLVPALDPTMPATLSPILVNGVLRGQLGYQGVVMTDSLYMAAISKRYTLPQAAVLSVVAGDDLLEGAYDSYSMNAMLAALHNAINDGTITTARIDQSVMRILELKARFGLIHMLPPPGVSTYGAALHSTSARVNMTIVTNVRYASRGSAATRRTVRVSCPDGSTPRSQVAISAMSAVRKVISSAISPEKRGAANWLRSRMARRAPSRMRSRATSG
jgi:beta-N-acetylhexosaminidase